MMCSHFYLAQNSITRTCYLLTGNYIALSNKIYACAGCNRNSGEGGGSGREIIRSR